MKFHLKEKCPKKKHRRRGRKRANPRKRFADNPRLNFVESKWFYRVAALGLAILLIVALVVVWPKPPARLEIGQPAPMITWDDGSLADFRGYVMLINFFDTDSFQSRDQMETLVLLYKHWVLDAAERGDEFFVEFVSVDINSEDTEDDLLNWKAEYVTAIWQMLLDNGQAQRAYFVKNAPVTFILDRGLVVSYVFEGVQKFSTLNNVMFRLVRG